MRFTLGPPGTRYSPARSRMNWGFARLPNATAFCPTLTSALARVRLCQRMLSASSYPRRTTHHQARGEVEGRGRCGSGSQRVQQRGHRVVALFA